MSDSYVPVPVPVPVRAQVSRRTLLGTATSLVAGLTLHGALAQEATPEASPAASPTAGGWSFTDAAGKTVTLPARPTRVVADLNVASALWDFGVQPIAVSGWTVTTDAAWGNVDRSTPVINASAESGEPDLEELLALQPDLFITLVWPSESESEYYNWTFTSPEQYALAEQIMPVMGMDGGGAANANLARLEELAASLGADLETPELAAARAAYETAVSDFRALAGQKADLVTAFVGITPDAEYLAVWPEFDDLSLFHELGLNIVTPEVPEGTYWETLSVEQANRYPVDVLFQSTRDSSLSLDEVRASPIYGSLPAVAAGQLGSWNQDVIVSYQGLTKSLTAVMETLASAEKVIPV